MSTPPPLATAWAAATRDAIVAPAAELGLLAFSGSDAASFLQGQLSSDVQALAVGAGHRSTYNSPKGRLLATLFVWRAKTDRYEALLAADIAEAIRKRLAMFVMRSKVAVTNETPTSARFGVGGPRAAAAIASAFDIVPPVGGVVASDATTVVHLPDGRFVVVSPASAASAVESTLAHYATPAPAAVWTWLRIRAGVPEIAAATQDLFVAQTANQDALGALDFRKGCYTGQEIIARTHYLGRLKERLFILASDAPPPAPATKLYAPAFGEQASGAVVDSAPTPQGGSLFLAVLRTEAASGPVAIGTPDGSAATFVPLPYALPEPAEPRGRVKL